MRFGKDGFSFVTIFGVTEHARSLRVIVLAAMSLDPSLHDEGALELARIATNNALHACSSTAEPKERKRSALAALLLVPWAFSIASKMGRSVLGNILKFCKNDPELSHLATLWKSRILELHRFDVLNISAYGGNSNTLVREWRRILIEGRLRSIAAPKIWSGLLSALNENAILSPKELMMVPIQDLPRLIPPDREGVDLDLLRRLWECSHTHNILSPFDVISTEFYNT